MPVTVTPTKATIEGMSILASSPVRWELHAGVKPFESEIDLRPVDAEKLLQGALRPRTLVMETGDTTLTAKGVYVLVRGVGENEFIHRVVMVDRRWFWSHAHVTRHFNMRRVVGSARQKAPDTVPELEPLTQRIAYAPFSLKDQVKPWTAREILENVLEACFKAEGKMGMGGKAVIKPEVGNLIDNLPIEDLELDDPADVALRRVLAYLPEASLVVELDGTVVVKSRADGKEGPILAGAGDESVGLGHVEFISNARIRPSAIHVLFTREHEVRFDFAEDSAPTHTEDERYMDNVLPIPDYQLTLKDAAGQNLGGDPVRAQGTWIPFHVAFNSWGAPPRQSNVTSAAGWYAFVRAAMVPYIDLWTKIGLNGQRAPDTDWMARLSAIQTHFRRTFRINHRWMARILQLKAVKVATLDPTTGTRAPALAYADFARVASQRTLRLASDYDAGAFYVMNVKSAPASATTATTLPAAPASVTITDHDQGIVSIDFHPDIYRMYEMILPSMVQINGSALAANGLPNAPGPTANINDATSPIAFNARGTNHKQPELTANHRVALVLTAIPAGSNSQDSEQLHRVVVSPGDVAPLLPPALASNIGQSSGPVLEIRINATIETARVAWDVSKRDEIEKAFGLLGGGGKIEELIINREGDYQGGASLKAIAHAVAARTWAALTDRWQGSKTVKLAPKTRLEGNIEKVSHEVTTAGAVQTRIELPGQLPSIDLLSLLPESTRRIVLRLAPSPGKAPK